MNAGFLLWLTSIIALRISFSKREKAKSKFQENYENEQFLLGIVNLPDDLLPIIFAYIGPVPWIPAAMFSCKSIFKASIKSCLFQIFLAWKYQIPGLARIRNHHQLLHIEGPQMNYFKFYSDALSNPEEFELLLSNGSKYLDQSLLNELALALFDLARQCKYQAFGKHCSSLIFNAICQNRSMIDCF